MRQDFEYHIPVAIAQKNSNKKRKRAILTGAFAVAFALRYWLAGLVLLMVLSVVNLIQRRRGPTR